MSLKQNARKIAEHMFKNDPFSQWLGIRIIEASPGKCTLEMKVRPEMLQGHGTAHGGISYSLADSALAFASNSQGRKAVSIETSISHTQPVFENDILLAKAKEVSLNHKIGIYHIPVTNQDGVEVALFKGTVYRKTEEWDL